VRLKRVFLDQVKGVYDYCMDLPEDISPAELQQQVEAVPVDELREVPLEPYREEENSKQVAWMKEWMGSLPCESCVHRVMCHKGNRKIRLLLQDVHSLTRQVDAVKGGLWPSFKRHLRFLQENGFVDERHRLTPDGFWASKLRLDQPLLIAEAIRKDAMDAERPEILAGSLAPFVWDKVQEVPLQAPGAVALDEIQEAFRRIMEEIRGMRVRKAKRGFQGPPLLFWPAAALYGWSSGMSWEELLLMAPVDEGDMASLIMRTADHLRQVANLKETHPRLAATAEKAVHRILREPVYLY
jgi:superfamily II RNA helicase